MKPSRWATIIVGVSLCAGTFASALAQDKPKPQLKLSGSYEIKHATPSEDGTVSLDFSATILNGGPDAVSGKLLLRDYANNDTVWARFGAKTIDAGTEIKVSAHVTVPKANFNGWSGEKSPPVFLYAEDDRGDVTMVNIPLVRATSK